MALPWDAAPPAMSGDGRSPATKPAAEAGEFSANHASSVGPTSYEIRASVPRSAFGR
jgi:hypothetical protein